MANMILCSGNLVPVKSGLTTLQGAIGCDVPWEVVPYVEPSDTTALYAQLVALNELDPMLVGLIVVGCCALYVTGYSAGLVIKKLKQA